MKKSLLKLTSRFLFSVTIFLLILIMSIALWVYQLVQDLPDERAIRHFNPHAFTVLHDKDGEALAYLHEDKNQIWAPLSQISESIKKAIIATEDPYFLKHSGINYRQTWESIKDNLRVWKLVRGGSTITQQVAKNVYLSSEKTLARKIREYFLAKRMESLLSKERILEIYMNEVGWGYGIYGIELASRFYLDKHADEVNIAEAAFLSAMLRNPSYYNPYKEVDRVIKRQQLVINLMLRHDLINREEHDEALSYSIELRRDKPDKKFTHIGLGRSQDAPQMLPCYAALIETYLLRTVGRPLLFDVGREVKTTIDRRLQAKVDEVIEGIDKENNKVSAGKRRNGVVLKDMNTIRAVGCTDKQEEAKRKIKDLGKPYYSYSYEFFQEGKIEWKDIVLITP
jgi:penicillin-binding protein 1A